MKYSYILISLISAFFSTRITDCILMSIKFVCTINIRSVIDNRVINKGKLVFLKKKNAQIHRKRFLSNISILGKQCAVSINKKIFFSCN